MKLFITIQAVDIDYEDIAGCERHAGQNESQDSERAGIYSIDDVMDL